MADQATACAISRQIVRQARLSSWDDDPTMRQLQLIQSRFNVPILVLSSILLARFVAANRIDNVLFCSRDCNLWLDLFALVKTQMGISANEQYFYTSRQARMKASPSYRRYATEMLQGNAMVVDICGTGWSLSHLMQTVGRSAPIFFIHQLPKIDDYEKMRPTPEGIPVHSLVEGDFAGNGNVHVEMCNYANHPQVVDVAYIRNSPHPVFAPELRSPGMLAMIREQRAIFRQTLALCETRGLGDALMMSDDKLHGLIGELYKSLCEQKALPVIFDAMHAADEADQMRQLKKLA